MMILGVVGGGIFALAWLVMSDSPEAANEKKIRKNNDQPKAKRLLNTDEMLDGLRIAMSNPQNWLIGIYGCVMYLPLCAFAELWGVRYLKLLYGIDSMVASSACVSVFIGMGIGSILGAWVSNKIQSRTRVMSIAALGTLACFSVVFYVPDLSFTTMRIVLFLGGLLSGGQTLYFVTIKENMPNQYAATAIGFTNAFVMSSAILFQPLLGLILDLAWDGVTDVDGVPVYTIENFKIAFSAVMIAFILGWIVMLFVRDTYKKTEEVA
jgi:sugar phosphate permease